MVDHALAGRLAGLTQQRGEDAKAVLGGVLGQFHTDGFGCCGHKISEAHDLRGGLATFHFGRPAHDEGHAVAAIKDVRLVAAQIVAGVVTGGEQFGEVGTRGAAVVTGDDDERVLGDACRFCGTHDLADGVIGFHDEVGIEADAAFALPFRTGQDRSVRGVQRQVEEERRALLRFRLDDFLCLPREGGQHVFTTEAGGTRAFAGVAHGTARVHEELDFFRGIGRYMVVFDEAIGHHVQRGTDAKVGVKADAIWAVGDRLGVVHIVHLLGFFDVQFLRRAIAHPVHAQVPFAHTMRGVALRIEHAWHGQTTRLDQARTEAAEHAALQLGTPGVATRHHAIARGCADTGARVRIGENHAFLGETIKARRGDLAFGIEAFHIAIAKIIAEDEDDVGFIASAGRDGESEAQQGRENKESVHG